MTWNTSYLHCRTQKNVLALVRWRFHVTRLPIVTYFCYDTSTMKNINLVETRNQLVNKYLLICLSPWLQKEVCYIIFSVLQIKLITNFVRPRVFTTYVDISKIQSPNVAFPYASNVVLRNSHIKYFIMTNRIFC